jgi:hypothetical protein
LQRGCSITRDASTNIARERASRSAMLAKSAGERRALAALGGSAAGCGVEVAAPPHAAKIKALTAALRRTLLCISSTTKYAISSNAWSTRSSF